MSTKTSSWNLWASRPSPRVSRLHQVINNHASHKWPQNGSFGPFGVSKASLACQRASWASSSSKGLQDHLQGLQNHQQAGGFMNPSLWVQGPCQLGTRCFKAQTHSVRDQGTTGGTWWHQWHPMGPLQVHVGIDDNFINSYLARHFIIICNLKF